ncbi:ATP-binding protein [Streptomyces sp. NPDC088400]|uniref:ATP-binding protein n=1 Tax=Streptomyces sp. NPDC088400 TaxID=3365861 RepID=UPI0037F76CD5
MVLIVSELGTNALLYTASGTETGVFHVGLALSEHVIAVSVTDAGRSDTAPKVTHAVEDALRGRGLDMVSTLAHTVTIYGNDQGHTITASVASKPTDGRGGSSRRSLPWLLRSPPPGNSATPERSTPPRPATSRARGRFSLFWVGVL